MKLHAALVYKKVSSSSLSYTFEQTFHKQVNLLDILWIDYEMKVWYSATVFTALLASVMALPGGQLDNEFMDYVLQKYMESKMLCKIGAE